MIKTTILIALALGLAACTSSPQNGGASSVAAPRASFDQYTTFAFGFADAPEPGYEVTPRSLEVQRRLRGLVKERLEHAGYVESAHAGDFVVKLATGMVAASPGSDLTQRSGPSPARGYLGVHLYDAQTGSMIWQSSAVADIDPDQIDDALLQRGVEHMLRRLPTAKKQLAARN
jgi:hypothetical protein